MAQFEVATKAGDVIGIYEADNSEQALLMAVADVGDWAPEIYDASAPHPETVHFDSVASALEVFVPEAIAQITAI